MPFKVGYDDGSFEILPYNPQQQQGPQDPNNPSMIERGAESVASAAPVLAGLGAGFAAAPFTAGMSVPAALATTMGSTGLAGGTAAELGKMLGLTDQNESPGGTFGRGATEGIFAGGTGPTISAAGRGVSNLGQAMSPAMGKALGGVAGYAAGHWPGMIVGQQAGGVVPKIVQGVGEFAQWLGDKLSPSYYAKLAGLVPAANDVNQVAQAAFKPISAAERMGFTQTPPKGVTDQPNALYRWLRGKLIVSPEEAQKETDLGNRFGVKPGASQASAMGSSYAAKPSNLENANPFKP